LAPKDATTKHTIRTRAGQEVTFDEVAGSVTIRNTTSHSLSLDQKEVKLATTHASVTLDVEGNVTITAAKELTLEAKVINITGTKVNIKGVASTTINGGVDCTIQAGKVSIN
jgi:hypothetical protein